MKRNEKFVFKNIFITNVKEIQNLNYLYKEILLNTVIKSKIISIQLLLTVVCSARQFKNSWNIFGAILLICLTHLRADWNPRYTHSLSKSNFSARSPYSKKQLAKNIVMSVVRDSLMHKDRGMWIVTRMNLDSSVS